MKKAYAPPEMTRYGTVEDLTRADQTTNSQDGIFNEGAQIGESVGSQDACISGDLDNCN